MLQNNAQKLGAGFEEKPEFVLRLPMHF